jgi:hypothetical protein
MKHHRLPGVLVEIVTEYHPSTRPKRCLCAHRFSEKDPEVFRPVSVQFRHLSGLRDVTMQEEQVKLTL